jgi:ATP-dependent DNA helicase RecQ
MAFKYPITMEEMENITGVGKNKARKFGEPFIKLISEYVEKHNIDRPVDFVLKSVVNRGAKRINIIQNIDKKVELEEIGKSIGFTFEEFLEELEAIVASGTKVDLGYIIDDILDEDGKNEIFDYFKETTKSDIDEAVREFGGEFTHEEMKIFQIQFMSDVAN